MPDTRTTPWMRFALLVLALGSVAGLGLSTAGVPLLPSQADLSRAKPSSSASETDAALRPVGGDGALPERAPRLRSTDAPLSVAERGYAIHLAQQSMPADATNVLGDPGGEVLAADLPLADDRGSGRRTTVSLYDYDTDRLHRTLVDLAGGSVVRSRETRGLQLPPSIAETRVAVELALAADPAPGFVKEYRQVTGAPLVAAEQVHAVAGVWRTVDGTDAPAEVCGRHRCVQLLLALPSGQYLGTQDFAVDLSSRRVVPVTPPDPDHDHEH